MISKAVIIILALSVLFLAACENIDLSKLSDEDFKKIEEKLIRCDPPYIRYAAGCCLDQDANKICDKDEVTATTPNNQRLIDWNVCTKDKDCGYIPHPCCPDWTTIIANGKLLKGVSKNSPECVPTPEACYTTAPALEERPLICDNGRCVVSEAINGPKDSTVVLGVSDLLAFPNEYRGTKIKVRGIIDIERDESFGEDCIGPLCETTQTFLIIRRLEEEPRANPGALRVWKPVDDGYDRFECEALGESYKCGEYAVREEAIMTGVFIKTQEPYLTLGSSSGFHSVLEWQDEFFLAVGDVSSVCTNNYCEEGEVESCPQDCASYEKVSCDNKFSCPQPINVQYRCHDNRCVRTTEKIDVNENPYFCQNNDDCEIKNVGNCCGEYPRCVNKDFVPDLESVKRKCEETGTASVCGFPEITHCECIESTCKSMQGDKIV